MIPRRLPPIGPAGHSAESREVAEDFDPKGLEHLTGDPGRSHTGCRLTGTRPLEDGSGIPVPPLLAACEVRMPRPRIRGRRQPLDHAVLVLHLESDGRTVGHAPLPAGENMNLVRLDPHAAPTAVAELPPREVFIHSIEIEGQSRRNALQDADERRPVGFTRCSPCQSGHAEQSTAAPRQRGPQSRYPPGLISIQPSSSSSSSSRIGALAPGARGTGSAATG